jgi:CRP-like cAMP-binding protein
MYDVPSLIGRLRGVRHFNQLSLTDLHTIVSSGQLLRFKAGAVIFREGDACSGLYVLLAGKVHLDKAGPQGQSTLMASIRPVIMFNEVSVLDGDCNPLSATTVKDSICWQISHERFQRLMLVYPTLGISLLNVLARRNRQLITRCEDIAFRTVMGRLAKILLELSKNGRAHINRREYTNLDLAARAATVPEPISRAIQTLRQDGVISCDRELIQIHQPLRLIELADLHPEILLN